MERTSFRSDRAWGSWGLRGLLLAAAALPTLLTLGAVLLLNVGADERMRKELEQRATLVAGALAEASEYGLISGNAAALDRSVRELLARDKAIAAIDILDASRRSFVSLPGQPVAAGLPSVELPVRSSVPDIDFFDRATPHVSMAEDLQPTFRLGPVAGYVRVTMTTEALRQAQRQRLGTELGVVAAAGLVGLLLVALLARRIRASLLGLLDALQSMRQGRYVVAEVPVIGGELRRVQGAVLDLAETLGTGAPAGHEGSNWQRHLDSHSGIARRLMGRLDAALVAVRLTALQVARQVDAGAPGRAAPASETTPNAAQTAARILALADQAHVAGDALVEPLRAQIVEALGLDGALAELLQACARAQPTCSFSLHQDPGFTCRDAAQAVEIHRAVQGALALVLAGGQASQASVRLQAAVPPSSEVRVVVSDNAAGDASNGAVARLTRWREALIARGTRVDVQQAPAGGTTLVMTLASPGASADEPVNSSS
jgi:two-component system sensor histidine kinase UhpB